MFKIVGNCVFNNNRKQFGFGKTNVQLCLKLWTNVFS